MQTAAFTASTLSTRLTTLAAAALITFGLLGGVGTVANQQYDDALMAQSQASAVHWAASQATGQQG